MTKDEFKKRYSESLSKTTSCIDYKNLFYSILKDETNQNQSLSYDMIFVKILEISIAINQQIIETVLVELLPELFKSDK